MIKINVKGYIMPGISIFFGLFSIYKIYDFFKKIINEHMRELVFIKCELYQLKNYNKLLEFRFTNNMNIMNNKVFQIEQNIQPNIGIVENVASIEASINDTNTNENTTNNEMRLKDLEYDCIVKNDIKNDYTPYKKHNSFSLPDIIKNIMF
jgi:LytS/YehU family sensor histidine kinase